MLRTSIAAVLALLAATPPQPQIPSLGETIEVTVVNVDVFVTDKSGNRVHGLTKDEFQIYEDGKLQPVSNFVEYAEEAPDARVTVSSAPNATPPPAAVPAVDRRQHRTISIFVDRLQLRANKQKEVFDQLRESVRKLVQPGDRVSVITWERTHTIRVRQPYTDDLGQIDGALAFLAGETAVGTNTDLLDIQKEDEMEAERNDLLAAHNMGPASTGCNSTGLYLAERAFEDMKAKVAALNALSSSMSGATGQKVLVMLSHRFSMNVGTEFFRAQRATPGPPDKCEVLWDMRRYVESVAQTANANGVRIYGIFPEEMPGSDVQSIEDKYEPAAPGSTRSDPGAPVPSGYGAIVLGNELGALEIVTQRTGGEMTWHPNAAIKLLDRLPNDFSSYYSLGYRATTRKQDRAHKISVKVTRPGLTVRSRTEFVEKSTQTVMGERVIGELFGIAANDATFGINVKTGDMQQTAKNRFTVPVSVEIPIESLTTIPQGEAANGAFSVYVAWSNGLGQVSDVTHYTRPFSIPAKDLENARTQHFTYETELVVDRRTNQVAVGVIDEVSKEFGVHNVTLAVR
jgi:VWFA-related protein